MRQFTIRVNGQSIAAEAEPRTHLADFLREQQDLTGTHIGCEHGVCGACTVLIDGSPARSCITYAVACEGAEITTIEGLRNDPIMAELRKAFSANHALQCGYCTPGMLITCRDIVMRIPEADEQRIRLELSGNLCRCTGYVGIVAAVQQILNDGRFSGDRPTAVHSRLGPVGARTPALPQTMRTVSRPAATAARATVSLEVADSAEQWREVETDATELTESFRVSHSPDQVWKILDDLDRVVRCMPGASLSKQLSNGRAEGEIKVKLGPIVSSFAGTLELERDDTRFRGLIRGVGRDTQTGSGARAVIVYQVRALDKTSSQVDVSIKFMLTGALAQFARSGLIKDVANHLTTIFANNLETTLSGRPIVQNQVAPLNAISLARSALWRRVRAAVAKLKRK